MLTDLQFDKAIEMILSGDTYTIMCKVFRLSRAQLHADLHKTDERVSRVREAQESAGVAFADKAEEVLLKAEGTKEELMRARELASHYRWRAKAANPKKFGDNVKIEGNMQIDVKQITGMKVE